MGEEEENVDEDEDEEEEENRSDIVVECGIGIAAQCLT